MESQSSTKLNVNLSKPTKENEEQHNVESTDAELAASDTQNIVDTEKVAPIVPESDEDLDAEYIDQKEIIISLVHNYSNYRKANMKVLGQRSEIIGSSINSCRLLSSNKGEVEAYFPGIVGLSPNHPDFTTRVVNWLSNIQFAINSDDAKLDASFIYNHKRDYLEFAKKEAMINATFDKVNKANLAAVKDALKRKIDALHNLESTKYKYGHPNNLIEYLMYRHCLLYHDVAKDPSLINSDPTLRFYIKDASKEAEKQKKLIRERKIAMQSFISLSTEDSKFDSVFIQIVRVQGGNLFELNMLSRLEKEDYVMKFVNSNPDKFNKIVSDKKLAIRSFIELLIARGELVRGEFNQQISTSDGTFIGSNMGEAIAYFESPANASVKSMYENKLKL